MSESAALPAAVSVDKVGDGVRVVFAAPVGRDQLATLEAAVRHRFGTTADVIGHDTDPTQVLVIHALVPRLYNWMLSYLGFEATPVA